MFGPERLMPGMADNFWNRGISESIHFNMQPDIVTKMMGPIGPEPSSAFEPIRNAYTPYISNNCGPGYWAPENEYRRLQKAAFDWEDYQIETGLKFIRGQRQCDWNREEKAIRVAERATGLKWEPKEVEIFPAVKPYEPVIIEPPKPLISPEIVERVLHRHIEPIEIAPIVHQTPSLTVFKGYGQSHFSYEDHEQFTGFHITTQIPGIGPSEGLSKGLSHHIRITETPDTLSFQEQPWISGGTRGKKKGLLGSFWDELKSSLK